ncbi:MAG: cytochrome c biogenesis protein [Bacteroidia bacterium]|nr:cytochrome c biogenesis protein [Bacteroidia bacterium]
MKRYSFAFKIITSILLLYSVLYGLLVDVPALPILNETIRNLFYHVPVWFAMMFMAAVGMFNAVRFLMKKELKYFDNTHAASLMVIFFSIPGLLTGMLWARFTWGTWWTFQEPKLNGVAISILIYCVYFLLTYGIPDLKQTAVVGSAYNIFSFVMMMIFIMVMPRLTSSLHPGNGGNPAFGSYDLDNRMRTVFYPAVLGWIGLSYWLYDLLKKYLWIQKNFSGKQRVY